MLTSIIFPLLLGVTFVHSASLTKEAILLPIAGCDDVTGKVCIPDACVKTTCHERPKAVCIPDRCGCEARFFELSDKDNKYHDVTKDCRSSTSIKTANFVHFSMSDAEAIAKNPEATLKVFRLLNSLTSESLFALANYLKQISETVPTEDNIYNYRTAVDMLKKLVKERRVMDTMDDDLEARIDWKKVWDVAKPVVSTLLGALLDEQQDVDFSDSERLIDIKKIREVAFPVPKPLFNKLKNSNPEKEHEGFVTESRVHPGRMTNEKAMEFANLVIKHPIAKGQAADENVLLMDATTGEIIPMSDKEIEERINWGNLLKLAIKEAPALIDVGKDIYNAVKENKDEDMEERILLKPLVKTGIKLATKYGPKLVKAGVNLATAALQEDMDEPTQTDANFNKLMEAIMKVLPQIKEIGSKVVEAIQNQNTKYDEGALSYQSNIPIQDTLDIADEAFKFLKDVSQ